MPAVSVKGTERQTTTSWFADDQNPPSIDVVTSGRPVPGGCVAVVERCWVGMLRGESIFDADRKGTLMRGHPPHGAVIHGRRPRDVTSAATGEHEHPTTRSGDLPSGAPLLVTRAFWRILKDIRRSGWVLKIRTQNASAFWTSREAVTCVNMVRTRQNARNIDGHSERNLRSEPAFWLEPTRRPANPTTKKQEEHMPTKQAGETNLADLSDLELVQYARDEITARAAKIAELTGLRRAAVEHGLYGYRWPTSKCGIDGLCDVLIESRMILDAVESGMTLGAAAGAVAMAVGVKEHGGKPLPKLVPPPVFPG